MGAPKVSIVIASYNCGRFIRNALDSVLAQSYQDYEVIVVDDGSTDDSRVIVETIRLSFGGKLKYLYQENRGVAAARNAGLGIGRGEYIAFLDADDCWHPDRLRRHIDIFNLYPSVGVCCSDFLININNERIENHFRKWINIGSFPYNRPFRGAQAVSLLLQANFVGTDGITIRRNAVSSDLRFDARYRQAEDYDLWLRCAMKTNFYVIDEPLHTYMVRGDSLTSNWLESEICSKTVLEELAIRDKKYIMENDLNDLLRLSIAKRWYSIGNLYYEQQEIDQAFRAYMSGMLSDPSLKNALKFSGVMGRKVVRAATFGMVTRRRVGHTFSLIKRSV